MSDITVMQVVEAIIKLSAVIAAVGIITGFVLKRLTSEVSKIIKPLNSRMDRIELDGLKNYLVTALANVEEGTPMPEIEKERFWESYGRYRELGGNHYIKGKVEDLRKDDKL